MSLLVVGSVAFDSIETPFGRHERVLGGSAVHFSYSASWLTDVMAVGVVGQDFPAEHIKLLMDKGIDVSGIERVNGNTFNWTGRYTGDMNSAETLSVNLNVLANFKPKLSPAHRKSRFVFLANGDPVTQLSVAEQVEKPIFVMADTMNLWIAERRPDLDKLFKRIDGLILNDGEARMLTGEASVIRAARKVLGYGLKLVIIKKGEHGALAVTPNYAIAVPAYPTEAVIDPTGAGDSFAGGTLGYLSLCGEVTPGTLRKALRYGTVTASFQVEDFGLDRHKTLTRSDIERRLIQFESML